MSLTAVMLVVTAAVIHAFWNLLGKRQSPSAAFFLVATVAAVAALFPVAVRSNALLPLIPLTLWAPIAVSCLCQALYYSALAGAYRNGDMSLAYPLARALPTLFITATTMALGIGRPITPPGMMGILLVAVGCLTIPVRDRRAIRRQDYLNLCCALAVVAGVGTTGYTVIDSEVLRILREMPDSGVGGVELTLSYVWLTSVLIAAIMILYIALVPAERARLARLAQNGWPWAVVAGLTITAGYSMVLLAMAHASNVSYIGAFRQTSIPLGAMLGIVVQKEPLYPAKVVGTAIIVAGLVMVALA